MFDKHAIAITSDGSGNATVSPATVGAGRIGALHAVYVAVGTLANTVDLTFTDAETGAVLLTLTNVAVSALYQPRLPTHDATGTAITGGSDRPPIGRKGITVAAAQPGNSKAGTVYVWIDEGAQS